MKVKLKKPVQDVVEQPTPAEFDDPDEYIGADDYNPRRRSLQVSIPDVGVIIMVHIFARIVGISFSQIIRELLKPYLEVVIAVLAEEGLLNEYGNIMYSPDKMYALIEERSANLRFLKLFVDKCRARDLNIDWVSKISL